MSSHRTFWAAVLILLGGLLLANNLGYLPAEVWNLFWPLALILAGIWFLWGSLRRSDPGEPEERSIALQGAERAEIRVQHGAGRLQIGGGAPPDFLLSGTFRGGVQSRVQSTSTGMVLELEPDAANFPDLFMPWNWTSGEGLGWNVRFNPDVDLAIYLKTGAGEAHLNLRELQVSRLELKTGASSSEITLPAAAGLTRARIEAGAAAVKIAIPEGVAARITAGGGLASIEVNQSRFPRVNDIYLSPDYDAAEHRVELEIETGLGSIEVL